MKKIKIYLILVLNFLVLSFTLGTEKIDKLLSPDLEIPISRVLLSSIIFIICEVVYVHLLYKLYFIKEEELKKRKEEIEK